jgi:spermidine synthase
MHPWEELARATAPDGARLVLRRRGEEYLIVAGGLDLMSSRDEASSRALARLGCAPIDDPTQARVLVGGLGMGFTLAAALNAVGAEASVEVAELVPAVVDWNRGPLAALAGRPLEDARTELLLGDVRNPIEAARSKYDAILLDVDNGPEALAHDSNEAIYGAAGLALIARALRPGGVLAVWSFSDDKAFTRRLHAAGFEAQTHRVPGSRAGRGRYHVICTARLRAGAAKTTARPGA